MVGYCSWYFEVGLGGGSVVKDFEGGDFEDEFWFGSISLYFGIVLFVVVGVLVGLIGCGCFV